MTERAQEVRLVGRRVQHGAGAWLFGCLAGLLAAALHAVAAATPSFRVAWDPSPDPEVIGYNLYFGYEGRQLTNKLSLGNRTSASLGNLIPGARYFTYVTALSASGVESAPSEVLWTIAPMVPDTNPIPPLAPEVLLETSEGVVTEGGRVELHAFANGTPPLYYLWYRDDAPLIGTLEGTLVFQHIRQSQAGTYSVLVQAPDGGALSQPVSIVVQPSQAPPPVVTVPSDVTIYWDGPFTAVFTVAESDAGLGWVEITAASSNPDLVQAAVEIPHCGIGPNLLRLTPAPGESGTATVTITVVSLLGKQTVRSFDVTVTEPIIPLSFSVKETLTTKENNATSPELIEIAATPSQINQVELSAQSLNPTLIPSQNVLFAGTGASRQMVIAPELGQIGQARLIIRATLGEVSFTREIEVIVLPRNTPPSIRGFPFELRLLSGQRRSFQFQVDDAEGDQITTFLLTFPLEFAPLVELSRTGNTFTVQIQSAASQSGTFEITTVAEDVEGLFDTATCVVSIVPQFLTIARTGDELVVHWSEVEGSALQFTVDLLEEWQPIAVHPSLLSPARGESRLQLDTNMPKQFFRIGPE